MLRITDLTFRYSRKSPVVLDGISLSLKDGEIGVLLGKNGSGKTTLFKTVLGFEKPEAGQMDFNGKDLIKMNRRGRAEQIAYVPQDIQFGDLTVFDTVLLGRLPYFGLRASKEDEEIVIKTLKEMGLEELAGRNTAELSGGERQKVAIARALAQEPKLLVFDEPTGNLDIANEQLILKEILRVTKEKGIGVLTSLHNLNEALSIGDVFFFIKDGKIRYFGDSSIVTEQVINDIYDADVSIIEYKGEKIIVNGGL
ncbi:MAG: ABC transporter ATP-binding protein [Lachnospiraceae bacterium]|nr:ABC transporter ATP-binding protein [Lachnospiraceae bacterium]MBR3579902.1 ABC transporter ATP-binding protein [Lachnospiraceae bacterium]